MHDPRAGPRPKRSRRSALFQQCGLCDEAMPLAQPRTFVAWLRVLFRHDWVVYSKEPFAGPDNVLRYLGALPDRVAISNARPVLS